MTIFEQEQAEFAAEARTRCFECKRKRSLGSNGLCSECYAVRVEVDRQPERCVRQPGGFGCPCDNCRAVREGYANNYGGRR